MGEEKRVKAKVVHKNEYEKDWLISNYVPDVGEVVFYKPEITETGEPDFTVLPEGRTEPITHTRQKNGDGINKVKNLPFDDDRLISENDMAITNNKVEENSRRISNLEGLLITHIIDDSEAYTKIVPTQAASKAILNRVGGNSVIDLYSSQNLCPIAVEGGIHFFTDETNEWRYRFSLPAGDYAFCNDVIYEGSNYYHEFELIAPNVNYSTGTFKLYEDGEIELAIVSNGSIYATGTSGWINFRVIAGTKAPTNYVPYEEPSYLPTKVTEIISRGPNILPTPYRSYNSANGASVVKRAGVYRKSGGGLSWYLEDYDRLIVSGTSEKNCYFTLQYECEIPKGTYTVTGCPKLEGCMLRVINRSYGNKVIAIDVGDGATFTLDENQNLEFHIAISPGVTLNSVIFSPNVTSFYKRNPIPVEIQNKEGYGTDEGYIDFDRKKWVYGDSEEDISNILTDYIGYKFIEVEGGGELIAENENKNPVPWTVTFAMTVQEET